MHMNYPEHECLFCLSYDYEDNVTEEQLIQLGCTTHKAINKDIEDVEDIEDIEDVEHVKNIQSMKTLFNYSTLFACECTIHAHPICMDEWLNYNSCCPICKASHIDTTIDTVISSPEIRLRIQDVYEDVYNRENNNTGNRSCCIVIRHCAILSISSALFYVLYIYLHH